LDYEEHIRDLCAKAASATDEGAATILAELRAAINEHILEVRQAILKARLRQSSTPDFPASFL
jgi:hypothetical protein